jgi:hypothetical protein
MAVLSPLLFHAVPPGSPMARPASTCSMPRRICSGRHITARRTTRTCSTTMHPCLLVTFIPHPCMCARVCVCMCICVFYFYVCACVPVWVSFVSFNSQLTNSSLFLFLLSIVLPLPLPLPHLLLLSCSRMRRYSSTANTCLLTLVSDSLFYTFTGSSRAAAAASMIAHATFVDG